MPNKPRGVPRSDDRKVLNGIYWRLRTGSPWVPERYGPATTCYHHFVRWRKLGVWDRAFDAVSKAYDDGLQTIDSSSIRVLQHGDLENADAAAGQIPHARCMGRSRGGLTTKIHVLVDADGNPIALKLSEGRAHDGKSAADMLGDIGPGQILLADRAYDSNACARPSPTRAAGPTSSLCRDG